MTKEEAQAILTGAKPGDKVFVSYLPGRANPSPQAALECARAVSEGINLRHHVGTLDRVWTSKSGDLCFTVLSETRDAVVDGALQRGGYRTFNPSLGNLLALEVLGART